MLIRQPELEDFFAIALSLGYPVDLKESNSLDAIVVTIQAQKVFILHEKRNESKAKLNGVRLGDQINN